MKIKFYSILILGLGLTLSIKPAYAQSLKDTKEQVLFQAGSGGYASYRIPAIITSSKGSIIAFCEGRKTPGDAGNIDLLFRRSVDGGNTWSAIKVLWNDGENTCGNPCVVIDRSTGFIWLLMTHNDGDDSESEIIRKTSKHSRTVWVTHSEDDGKSWSRPVNITSSVKKADWGWYATGPGIGIQIERGSHKGRLVIPCDHSYDDAHGHVRQGPYEYADHIIYSDDHGKSWHLGGSIKPKVNECQLVELADHKGGLLMNMRSYYGNHCRAEAYSFDGGMIWTNPEDVPALLEPVCQASILRYSWPKKNKKGVVLFLNPADSSKRRNMSIRLSYDDGKSWSISKSIYAGPSAYSCMTVLPDHTVGCLFEAGEYQPYEKILFRKISLKEIIQ